MAGLNLKFDGFNEPLELTLSRALWSTVDQSKAKPMRANVPTYILTQSLKFSPMHPMCPPSGGHKDQHVLNGRASGIMGF